MEVAHAEQLAEMLLASAVSFEMLELEQADGRVDCVDLRIPLVRQTCDDIGSWFQLLFCVAYDATLSLQALLDFLVVILDGYEREDVFKVKFCSAGVLLQNAGGR